MLYPGTEVFIPTTLPRSWNKLKDYLASMQTLIQLKVVSVMAKTGVKLIQDYASVVTDDEQ